MVGVGVVVVVVGSGSSSSSECNCYGQLTSLFSLFFVGQGGGGFALDSEGVEVVERLLTLPLSSLALRVLELEDFNSLFKHLPWSSRKAVCLSWCYYYVLGMWYWWWW